MTHRQLPSRDYEALKAATHRLVEMCGGPASAAQGVSRVASKGTLSRYGSTAPEHAETFAPIDVIADLEADCGDPVVGRALAGIAGYVLVPVGTVGAKPPDWIGHLGQLLVTEVEVKQRLVGALNGSVTPDQAEQIHAAVLRAMERLGALGQACRSLMRERAEP